MGGTSPSQKYAAISSRIADGITRLYPSEVQFYLNYCNSDPRPGRRGYAAIHGYH